MRPDRIVLLSPLLDNNLGLLQGAKDFAVQEFIAELAIEALDGVILQGTARLDKERFYRQRVQPGADLRVAESRTIIGTNVGCDTALAEQFGQALLHLIAFEIAFHTDLEALAREFIDEFQGAERFSVMRAIRHKVIAPDMHGVRCLQAYTRSVIEPQPSSFGLLFGHFQPFGAPNTLDPLVFYLPTRAAQQRRHAPVTLPSKPAG